MKTILVVDDFAMTRFATCLPLKLADYRVVEARSTNEALRYLNTTDTSIDLIVTDLHMPGITGAELIQVLRKSVKYKCMPILVVAASKRENEIQETGANAFVPKPFMVAELLDMVEKLLC